MRSWAVEGVLGICGFRSRLSSERFLPQSGGLVGLTCSFTSVSAATVISSRTLM